MKRVEALYRVSTLKQLDITKDDIPMQRIACHEFVKNQGWTIVKEYEEKGISGFKVSASDRDAIQELKDDAINHKFDILLVFMFDRLGRIENETPFVLEWFTEHGIAVWSVNEGEQKFDSHVDKLMNYIRFWQASGESEKTSIRVKTRLNQMTSEGIYTGGALPYGYHLEFKGRKNKKGHEMGDIAVEPVEAETVKQAFQSFAGEGTSNIGRSFINSYASVCLEGAIIVLGCIIYSLFASSPPSINAGAAAATQVWTYLGELAFNMLVLVGTVKLADRVCKEMLGL